MVDAPAQPARIAPLDGLRGCAILLVIGAHAASPQVQSLGAAGVTVFFVLSGYLITTILLRHRSASPSGRLRTFYVRRARRLLPALALLLVFETAVRISSGQSLVPVLLAGGYATNLAASTGSASTLDHTWSLALEEQFYVLWPLLLPAVWRRQRAVAAVLGLAAVSAVARAAAYTGGLTNIAWFSPLTRGDAILVGCALALAMGRGWSLPTGLRGRVLAGLAVTALAAPFIWTSMRASLWLIPLVSAATAVLIAWLVQSRGGPLAPLLSVPPLRWTGRLSYAMYLWHPFALAVVVSVGVQQRFFATWALSAAIAAVSWVFVERHFLAKAPEAATSEEDVHSSGATESVAPEPSRPPSGVTAGAFPTST